MSKLVKKVRALDEKFDEIYAEWSKANAKGKGDKLTGELEKLHKKLAAIFPEFHYRPKFSEELIVVAANIHEMLHTSFTHLENFKKQRKSAAATGAHRR